MKTDQLKREMESITTAPSAETEVTAQVNQV